MLRILVLAVLTAISWGSVEPALPQAAQVETSSEQVVAETVDEALVALKGLDMASFNVLTDNRQLMTTPWGTGREEYTLFGELCGEAADSGSLALDERIVQELSWEIRAIHMDCDRAVIRLRLTNRDMQGIFAAKESTDGMIAAIEALPPGPTRTTEIVLRVKQSVGQWQLHIDQDFVEAATAGLWVLP